MHDIKFIRENPEAFDKGLAKRGVEPKAKNILKADGLGRKIKTSLQQKLNETNKLSKLAGEAKAQGYEEEFQSIRKKVTETKGELAKLEEETKQNNIKFQFALRIIPNLPMEDVPVGKDEEDNKELRRWGDIPQFGSYTPQEHFNIPSVSKGMDFETAAKISGSRFVFLSGAIARVHRALAQFMLDLHTDEHGLTEINTPVIVNSEALQGTGQLPKFADDCYKISNKTDEKVEKNNIDEFKIGNDQWLIPTSEVSLTNIVADMILNKDQLPKRYCAHSLCFRKEAGAAGRDTAGMLRQHQFEKVEMVFITHPKLSRGELDRMTTYAEAVLKKLGLPFRTVVLCTGDMGFSAQRTHDIEVWLPGQNRYREISSVSVCGDFQARRMNARFREKDGDKPQFVHTLNGSGVAVGRCLIAVLENGQQKDGSVKLPKALHPYLGGKDTINPDGILEKAT